jgi:hypothetical protein
MRMPSKTFAKKSHVLECTYGTVSAAGKARDTILFPNEPPEGGGGGEGALDTD